MRHAMRHRKLGRTSAHRSALFRNQLSSMIEHERIITTLPKAKELRPLIEKLVTLAKEDSVHHRRQVARSISNDTLVARLFTTISPRFTERPGGYTRIVKMGPRRGDGAEMAILEFIDYAGKDTPAASDAKPAKAAKPAKKAAPKADAEKAGEKPKKAAPKKTAKPKADGKAAAADKPKRTRKKTEEAK